MASIVAVFDFDGVFFRVGHGGGSFGGDSFLYESDCRRGGGWGRGGGGGGTRFGGLGIGKG
jgi:hypothetical protein